MQFKMSYSISLRSERRSQIDARLDLMEAAAQARKRELLARLSEQMNTLRRVSECRSGASALEFAICCPLFFALVLGILSYGMYIGACHSVSQLAADAARASVAGLSQVEREKIAKDHVSRNAAHYPLLDIAKLTVLAGVAVGEPGAFRIVVKYDASGLPVWSAFVTAPNSQIERTAVIVNGGY